MRTAGLIGILLLAGVAGSFSASPPDRDPAWVADRVTKWQPTERERRWEKIGWAKDIRDAERIAKKLERPMFLYTHDGRLAVGRC